MNDKKIFRKIADEFLEFVSDSPIIAHNVDFDVGFLNYELVNCEKDKLKNKTIDTVAIAREKFPGASSSLDALCKRYRIDNSKRTQHSALVDCALLSKVYINLIDQKEPTLNFQNFDDEKEIKNDTENNLYYKKIVKISDAELNAHKQYLKLNLKKNFFS